MKKVLYFVLSILATVYILSLSAGILLPGLKSMGMIGEILYYFNIYGGAAIAFLLAAINFTGNIFKTILNVVLIVVTLIYIAVTFFPDFFSKILGFI